MEKCVVSLSGGRDSATCLGLAVDKFGAQNVYAIGFDYGSKHPQELEQAKKIAAYYEVPYQIIKINPEIFKGSACTLLEGSEKEVVKDKTYAELLSEKEGKVDTYVPARNTLFSAYSLAKAESISQEFDNCEVTIMLGQHADDSGYYVDENGKEMLDESKAAYPDCSVSFVNAFAEVARISSVGKTKYWTPFVRMHKWQLIVEGLKLKKPVPYHLCFSCYDPVYDEFTKTYHECRRCATCLDVKEAYNKALEYIKEHNPELYDNAVKELVF